MFKKLVTSSTSTVAAQNAGRQNLLKASAAKLSCSKSYSSEVAEVKGAGGLVDRMFYTFKPSDLINDKFSKLFCIEGNIGVGKAAFAKAMAEKFDLKYVACADPHYNQVRRCDVFGRITQEQKERELNNPDSLVNRSNAASIDYFCQSPDDWEHTVNLRYKMLTMRNLQMGDALAHLLHYGQGVAMVRHFYSDGVFAEAQRKMRWFHDRPEMRDQSGMAEKYYHNRFFSLNQHLLRPQVVLYLKMPAEEAHERVQNDPDASPYEKMLPLDYFHAIEEAYVDNLNQARNQGTTVIELNVSMLKTEEILFDLHQLDSFDSPFSSWQPGFTLDKTLRKVRDYNMDYFKRLSLTEVYNPVECTWTPKWYTEQVVTEGRIHGDKARGFDPRTDGILNIMLKH